MDKSQFISVIGTLQESVRRFLIVLTHGDKELTDDLAQNAIIKAYLHCGTFDGRAKLQTWIFRIAYNEYLNEQIAIGKEIGMRLMIMIRQRQ